MRQSDDGVILRNCRKGCVSLKYVHVCPRVIKRAMMCMCIISEWVDNGEFETTDRVVVAGGTLDAVIVSLLMRRNGKRVYQCREFQNVYRYESKTKWIVFGERVLNCDAGKGYDILFMPCDILDK